MESDVTTKTITTLKLNELEVSYLKGLVQNPASGDPQFEGDFERNMRQSFWNALSSANL